MRCRRRPRFLRASRYSGRVRRLRLHRPGNPLRLESFEPPALAAGEVRLQIGACGVCRTDLHIVDGELPDPRLPLVPGHEIVGRVVELGPAVEDLALGARVGVPWLGWTCGECRYCRRGDENLCERARFTGYQIDGGYSDQAIADSRYCLALPERYDDLHAAPLLCAGLIGYRAYRMAADAKRIGLYGFGAAAHLIAQVAVAEGREVFAFVRPGDTAAEQLAHQLGAAWAGASTEAAPEPLDAALIFAPVGALVPKALADLDRGGRVICAGIHMSEIPAFDYARLWHERSIRSVANLTRADGEAFMRLAQRVPLEVSVQPYPLEQAQRALDDLRAGGITGAAVLLP
jgi:propanol-preferring alcohol dehydrogenase